SCFLSAPLSFPPDIRLLPLPSPPCFSLFLFRQRVQRMWGNLWLHVGGSPGLILFGEGDTNIWGKPTHRLSSCCPRPCMCFSLLSVFLPLLFLSFILLITLVS